MFQPIQDNLSNNYCVANKFFEDDTEFRVRCSRRSRLEPVLLQPVAGLAIVAERDIIRVLGKYVRQICLTQLDFP
jgi:hypothetical protein